jgi:hypothetical protein
LTGHSGARQYDATVLAPGGAPMPVNSLLKNLFFKPEDIQAITQAYERARLELGLMDPSDPLCKTVAKKIIDIAEAGERDPEKLCREALEELGRPAGDGSQFA